MPEPPPVTEPMIKKPDRYSDEAYKARVVEDAKTAGVLKFDVVDQLKKPFPRFTEFSGKKVLQVYSKAVIIINQNDFGHNFIIKSMV